MRKILTLREEPALDNNGNIVGFTNDNVTDSLKLKEKK